MSIVVSQIIQLQSTVAAATASIVCSCALAAAIGISLLGCKFLDSAARQPEIAPTLFTRTLVIAGLIEVIPLLGVGISMIFTMLSPFTAEVVKILPQIS